jgi:hypothetical protein
MVFHSKKEKPNPAPGAARMRSRESAADIQGTAAGSGNNPLARRFQDSEEPDTMDLSGSAGLAQSTEGVSDEPTTRIMSGGEQESDAMSTDPLENPVAGFLAVIEGPGRGVVFTVAYGRNSIGSDTCQGIALNHGDTGISRENHCTVTFDLAGRKFYVQPGDGRQITYLDDEPLLAPALLKPGSHIRLSDTVLRFVALCGDDFSWESHG